MAVAPLLRADIHILVLYAWCCTPLRLTFSQDNYVFVLCLVYELGRLLFPTFIQRLPWGCHNRHLPEFYTESFCEMGTHKLAGWAPTRGVSFAGYLVPGVTAPWDYL